jgi:aerobic-type carbon monoxide dehydrogenase small subunit (CoxS/CutS family)
MPSRRKHSAKRNGFSPSRRRFLQGVGVGTAAAVVAPHIATAQLQVDEEVAGQQRIPIRLKVNGITYRLSVDPRWTLLDVLRNQLDLTGTKRVCDRAECGACTILRNGLPIYACMTLAIEAQGYELETIEGLSKSGRLHPVQEAFVKHDALQCGFCTPGMVMSVKALLDHNSNPSLDDVKAAISGNICKCGTYTKIFRAALDAAATLRGGR